MTAEEPVPINFSELEDAFFFVSSGIQYENSAYICLDTGKIYLSVRSSSSRCHAYVSASQAASKQRGTRRADIAAATWLCELISGDVPQPLPPLWQGIDEHPSLL